MECKAPEHMTSVREPSGVLQDPFSESCPISMFSLSPEPLTGHKTMLYAALLCYSVLATILYCTALTYDALD